ncbi:MAG: UbiA family prenyltransferase [Bacteroidales bacterium]|nr:UbiA family prenyltransferase [Bacteroidales bacterium]
MLKLYWQLFRGYNLLMIACTMLVLHVFHTLISANAPLEIPFSFIMLVISIMFIAAGGNCINDCMDTVSDQFNHKALLISPQGISASHALKCYIAVTAAGLVTAIVPALELHSYLFYTVFPLSAISLYLYSKYLKRRPLIGNITVATLTAMVIITQFLYYHLSCSGHQEAISSPSVFFTGHLWAGTAAFAFWLTLIRELVKTMEDVDGDAVAAFHTIAVIKGIPYTKNITAACTIPLIIALLLVPAGLLAENNLPLTITCRIIISTYFVLSVCIPSIILLYKIIHIRSSRDCHQASRLTKIIMLNGIFTFLTITLLHILIC